MLWGIGRDEDAEERLEIFEDDTGDEAARRDSIRRGNALVHVRRDEEGLEALRRGLDMGPKTAESLIDFALALVRVGRGPREPRELLEEARKLPRNRLDRFFEQLVDAHVLLAEERFDAAIEALHRARRAMRWVSLRGIQRAVEVDISMVLCLAHAGLGHAEAFDHYREACTWLEDAGRLEDLIRCERAMTRSGIPYR
jgi:hypothetical protein